ncbi:unnamed protein product [Rotaria sp. Silwood2]|nr:unnamed protein product [Rotaria sp. Silwood2]
MYRSIQDNAQNPDNSDNLNTTKIRRTIIERGTRTVMNDRDHGNAPSTNISAITARTRQHEDEKHELRELNMNFTIYLDHVQHLENYNGQLLAELETLKQEWGNDTSQLHETYGPDLKSLRNEIGNCLRDQVYQELLLKQYEYDMWQTQQRIDALDDNTSSRLKATQQELNQSIDALEQIKNQYDRYSADLVKQRTNVDNLSNQLNGLTTELVNHRLERIMIENEIQTLQEQAAFEDSAYQVQREEILLLGKPALDTSKFYHTELIRAISDIRNDFQDLAITQAKNLEEYYRIKMEQIQEIAQENERKRFLAIEKDTIQQSLNSNSLIEIEDVYKELKIENNLLQKEFDDLLDDLTRIQNENIREQQKLDIHLNQLREDIANKQTNTETILDNNVSLRFELSTYRSLLNSEEQRLHRLKQEKQSKTSSTSSSTVKHKNPDNVNQNPNNNTTQKLSTQTSATGSILIDSVDLINDCIIIKCEKSTSNEQSLGNWIIRRQNDRQPVIVYRFPSSFIIKPGQIIRILSKRSPQSATSSDRDVLVADQINTWGSGQVMLTSLIDNYNEERATIKHTFLPT